MSTSNVNNEIKSKLSHKTDSMDETDDVIEISELEFKVSYNNGKNLIMNDPETACDDDKQDSNSEALLADNDYSDPDIDDYESNGEDYGVKQWIRVSKGHTLPLPKKFLRIPQLKHGKKYNCLDREKQPHIWGLRKDTSKKKHNLCVAYGWKEFVEANGYEAGDKLLLVFDPPRSKFYIDKEHLHNIPHET